MIPNRPASRPHISSASALAWPVALLAAWLAASCPAPAADPAWRTAEPGWAYAWPRDHGTHREFKTEWWYFTGNVRTPDGRRFGYELTFFRSGLRPPGSAPATSRFVVDDLKIAHFAVTDVQGGDFHFSQKISRGAFGEAGFATAAESRLAWADPSSLVMNEDGGFQITAREDGFAISLDLQPAKPLVAHGENGVSRKADAAGHASHYYSATRLRSTGSVEIEGRALAVAGESWFDHEWATNQLAPDQKGWDWFSLQFDDGTELMLYQLRRRDGTADPASSGTWVAADGTARHLRAEEIRLTPLRWWKSKGTGGSYPIGWRVEIPALALDAEVSTPVETQELALKPISYWEGLVDARGKRNGKPVQAHGYLELTGYAGEIVGLSPGGVTAAGDHSTHAGK